MPGLRKRKQKREVIFRPILGKMKPARKRHRTPAALALIFGLGHNSRPIHMAPQPYFYFC
jgi:hypothetical protein